MTLGVKVSDADVTRHRRPAAQPAPAESLSSVDRSRLELWIVTCVLMMGLAVAIFALSFVDTWPEFMADFAGSVNTTRVALVALGAAFVLYVVERERRLRRVAARIMSARVLESALTNRLTDVLAKGNGSLPPQPLELDEALDSILRIGLELLEADEGSLMLAEGDALVLATAIGRASMFLGQRVPMTQGPAGEVARTRHPVLLHGRRDDSANSDGIRCSMIVPLVSEAELVGVMNLSVVAGAHAYDGHSLGALTEFGSRAAAAIRSARARRRDRVRAEMTANLAEDLREPLERAQRTVFLMQTQNESMPDAKRADVLRSLERDLDRVNELVRWLGGPRETAEKPES